MEGRDTVLEGGTPYQSRAVMGGTVAHGEPTVKQRDCKRQGVVDKIE